MSRRFLTVAATVAATAALGGCSDDEPPDRSAAAADDAPAEVRTTRVEVVEGLGKGGAFDPRALYERLSPGVVTVLSIFDGRSLLSGSDDEEGGQGSGFVLDGDGYVATNAHVVTNGEGRSAARAKEVYVEFRSGDRVRARIVGTDPNADVALLKLDPAGLRLTPLELASSSAVKVGSPVAAIGSPFGERQSLSVGVISAIDRTIESLTQFQIGDAIQTDAAINPGNSGGPLLNAAGRVLGINSQIKTTDGAGAGVGFAIPVDTVRRSLKELRDDGSVDYAYLGVTSQSLYPQLARRLRLGVTNGALIVAVQDGSPAEKAGLEPGERKIEFQGVPDVPVDGDVIVAVDGKRLTRTEDLADVISRHSAGDEVELDVLRDGRRRSIDVELGERPDRAARR